MLIEFNLRNYDLPALTPLFEAMDRNDLGAVQKWVGEHGIDFPVAFEVPDRDFNDHLLQANPLHVAILKNRPSIAIWLLKQGASTASCSYMTDMGYRSGSCYHPLWAAINDGMDDLTRALLAAGVDFDETLSRWNEDSEDPWFNILGAELLSNEKAISYLHKMGCEETVNYLRANAERWEKESERFN